MAQIAKLKRLPVSLDQIPDYALSGGTRFADVPGMVVAEPNKLNIPDSRQRQAGPTHTDVNEGNQSVEGLTFKDSASCVGPGHLSGWMAPRGVNIETISPEQCVEVGIHISDTVGGTGVGLLTSQMSEAYGAFEANKHYTTNTDPKSALLEKALAERQEAKGGHYYSGYDGVIRYDCIQRPSDAELASDGSIVDWINSGIISGFGQRAFKPHELADGSSVMGACQYRDLIVATYFQGHSKPNEFVSDTAFRLMAVKRGLVHAATLAPNQALAQKIRERHVMNFTWNTFSQIGNHEHMPQRIKPKGLNGLSVANYFQPTSPSVMFSSMLYGLLETNVAYCWEDTTRFGSDPLLGFGYNSAGELVPARDATQKSGQFNGGQRGYLGPETITFTDPVYKYVAGAKCPYPVYALGNMDISVQVIDAYSRLKSWVSNNQFGYASMKGDADTDYCDATNVRRYVRDRFKANRVYGWVAVDTSGDRLAVVVNMFHKSAFTRENVSLRIGGLTFDLRDKLIDSNGAETTVGLRGGRSYEFFIDLAAPNNGGQIA